MSDAIVLDVLSSSPVQLDVGDADPIAREEIAALATRVTTVEGDVSGLSTRVSAAEGAISTLGTAVDGIDARVEAIEADYVTSEDVMGALGGEAPTLVSGSSRAMLGDPETASWMERTTAADGAALIESVKGNTLRWNQLTGTSPDEVTEQITGRFTTPRVYICNVGKKAGHKYLCSLEAKVSAPSTMTFEMYLSDDHVETVVSQRVTETTSYVRRAYIFTVTQDYAISNFGYRNFTYVEGEDVSLSTRNGFCVDLTAMFGAGNEPSTVAEFEALFPEPYYPYNPGSLLPVRMEGIETVAADESWSSECTIPAATYFPDGMRSAGSVYDELTETQAITRVGVVDLGTLTWTYNGTKFSTTGIASLVAHPTSGSYAGNLTCALYENASAAATDTTDKAISVSAIGNISVHDSAYTDAAAFKAAMSGVMLHYALATPTTTPIDPPLPLSYHVGAGGTERVMVADGTMSAPPIFATRYPLDPADLAASIAPRESATAKTNHQVGDLLMLGFTLCKVTTAIATGETIAIGTNVTKTTVAAEIAALS